MSNVHFKLKTALTEQNVTESAQVSRYGILSLAAAIQMDQPTRIVLKDAKPGIRTI